MKTGNFNRSSHCYTEWENYPGCLRCRYWAWTPWLVLLVPVPLSGNWDEPQNIPVWVAWGPHDLMIECIQEATMYLNSFCQCTERLGSTTPVSQQHRTQLTLHFTPATEFWHSVNMNSSTKQIHRWSVLGEFFPSWCLTFINSSLV